VQTGRTTAGREEMASGQWLVYEKGKDGWERDVSLSLTAV
jgi:hypothetical protein